LPPVGPRLPKLPNDSNMGEVPRRGSLKPLRDLGAGEPLGSRRFSGEDAAILRRSCRSDRCRSGLEVLPARQPARCAARAFRLSAVGSGYYIGLGNIGGTPASPPRRWASSIGGLDRSSPFGAGSRAPSGKVSDAETADPMHVETALRVVHRPRLELAPMVGLHLAAQAFVRANPLGVGFVTKSTVLMRSVTKTAVTNDPAGVGTTVPPHPTVASRSDCVSLLPRLFA
jgi:hypothetical protein